MCKDITEMKMAIKETQINIDHIQKDISGFVKCNAAEHDEIKIMFKEYINKVEKEKAGVWVEKAMMWGALAVVGSVITAVMNVII